MAMTSAILTDDNNSINRKNFVLLRATIFKHFIRELVKIITTPL